MQVGTAQLSEQSARPGRALILALTAAENEHGKGGLGPLGFGTPSFLSCSLLSCPLHLFSPVVPFHLCPWISLWPSLSVSAPLSFCPPPHAQPSLSLSLSGSVSLLLRPLAVPLGRKMCGVTPSPQGRARAPCRIRADCQSPVSSASGGETARLRKGTELHSLERGGLSCGADDRRQGTPPSQRAADVPLGTKDNRPPALRHSPLVTSRRGGTCTQGASGLVAGFKALACHLGNGGRGSQ